MNKDEFLKQAVEIAGVQVEVVSGVEEGRLIYVGAIHALPILTKKALVIDIGGGSTETVVGVKGEHYLINSAKLGSIRLSQRFFTTANTTAEQVNECREFIRGELSPTFQQILQFGFEIAVATSGTAHALAAMALTASGKRIPDVINGVHITRDELLRTIEQIIAAGTSAKRTEIPGMESNRAGQDIPSQASMKARMKPRCT